MLHGKKVCKFALLQKEENTLTSQTGVTHQQTVVSGFLPIFCTGQLLVSLSQWWGEPSLGLAPPLRWFRGSMCLLKATWDDVMVFVMLFVTFVTFVISVWYIPLSSRCLPGFPTFLARSWSILLKLYAILIALYKSGIVIFLLQGSGIVFYTEVHGEFSE